MPRPNEQFDPAAVHRILRSHVGRTRAIRASEIARRLGLHVG